MLFGAKPKPDEVDFDSADDADDGNVLADVCDRAPVWYDGSSPHVIPGDGQQQVAGSYLCPIRLTPFRDIHPYRLFEAKVIGVDVLGSDEVSANRADEFRPATGTAGDEGTASCAPLREIAKRNSGPIVGQVVGLRDRIRYSPAVGERLKDLVCRFDAGLFIPPVGGEAARAGGGEDGLAEPLERRRHAVQAGAGGRHLAEDAFHRRHDPPLLGKRGKGKRQLLQIVSIETNLATTGVLTNTVSKPFSRKEYLNETWENEPLFYHQLYEGDVVSS